MFAEYRATTDRLVAAFGTARRVADLQADDFDSLRADFAKQFGPVRVGNEVQKARTLFKHAYEAGMIDRPMRFGAEFKKPSKPVMRAHRPKAGKRTFRADELRTLIAAAGVHLRAMVLLGANCGFGNADCGQLPLAAVDLDAGWVEFPRSKTGVPRRCPLWPETAAAVRAALADRPAPKWDAAAGLVFVTKYGGPWAVKGRATAVTHEFGKMLARTGLARPGLGFYSLRQSVLADAGRVKARCEAAGRVTAEDKAEFDRLHARAGELSAQIKQAEAAGTMSLDEATVRQRAAEAALGIPQAVPDGVTVGALGGRMVVVPANSSEAYRAAAAYRAKFDAYLRTGVEAGLGDDPTSRGYVLAPPQFALGVVKGIADGG